MVRIIKQQRPKDTILNIGIGIRDQDNAEFYLFPGLTNGWSTFSNEEAEIRKRSTGIVYQTLSMPLMSINAIMKYLVPILMQLHKLNNLNLNHQNQILIMILIPLLIKGVI